MTLAAGIGLFPGIEAEEKKIPVGTEIGKRAPDFTLGNLQEEEISLSNYRAHSRSFWTESVKLEVST